jgi:hypothetical protein
MQCYLRTHSTFPRWTKHSSLRPYSEDLISLTTMDSLLLTTYYELSTLHDERRMIWLVHILGSTVIFRCLVSGQLTLRPLSQAYGALRYSNFLTMYVTVERSECVHYKCIVYSIGVCIYDKLAIIFFYKCQCRHLPLPPPIPRSDSCNNPPLIISN